MAINYTATPMFLKKELSLFAISLGEAQGFTIKHVFGRNSAVGTTEEILWKFSTNTVPFPSAAENLNITSSSANDTSAGTGARTVKIEGLDASYSEISETVTMNGTNNVLTANSFLRVSKMQVATAGSGEKNAGSITAVTSTGGLSLNQISANEGMSHSCVFTIPASKTGYLVARYRSVHIGAGNATVNFILNKRTAGGVRSRLSYEAEANTGGNTNNRQEKYPVSFAEKTDIWVSVIGGINGSDVSSELVLLLVDN